MMVRGIAFIIIGLALGGCMQETLQPSSQASWNARDKQLMSNLPYAQAWSGIAKVGRMEEWPAWVPTSGEQARLGPLPAYVTGGPHNPMGARGMYLYSGNKDTLYRIHGTNQPEYIGQAISSGCIRMTNEDAIDLYSRVKVGTIVVVLAPKQNDSPFGAMIAAGPDPKARRTN